MADPLSISYIASVEELFALVRSLGLILSAKDAVIAKRWEEAGIPLEICLKAVIKGMRAFRRHHGPLEQPPLGLAYFVPIVEKAHEKALKKAGKAMAAAGTDTEAGSPREPLADTLARIKISIEGIAKTARLPVLVGIYRDAWKSIMDVQRRFVQGTLGEDRVYSFLSSFEDDMIESLLGRLKPAIADAIANAVDERVETEFAHLGEEAKRTEATVIMKQLLHERYGMQFPQEHA